MKIGGKEKASIQLKALRVNLYLFVSFAMVLMTSAEGLTAKPPFRIGVLAPMSGTYAKIGDHELWGIKVAVDELNEKGGILGRKIEIIAEDTEANPTIGARKAEKLILQDKVEYIIGAVSSGVSMAIMPLAKKYNKVHIVPISGSPRITEDMCSRNTFKVGSNFRMQALAIGPWIIKNLGKSVYFIGADYAMGWDGVKVIKEVILANGGTVVGEVFAPLGTTDYAPYIGGIKRANPDVLFLVVAGHDAVRLVTQLEDFGIKKLTKIVGYEMIIETAVLPGMGKAAEGLIASTRYVYIVDTPENKKFIERFLKYSKGEYPNEYSQASYESVIFLAKGTEKVGSTETQKVIEALEGISWVSLTGPVYFWADNHQAIRDKFIVKIENGQYKILEKFKGETIKGPDLCKAF